MADRKADHKADTRKLIVKLRGKGMGYTAIATQLNREGVATFGGGKQWYAVTVRNIVLQESPEAAARAVARAVAARPARHDGDTAVYACGVCGKEGTADTMIVSGHTGARYCAADIKGCRERMAKRKAAEAREAKRQEEVAA